MLLANTHSDANISMCVMHRTDMWLQPFLSVCSPWMFCGSEQVLFECVFWRQQLPSPPGTEMSYKSYDSVCVCVCARQPICLYNPAATTCFQLSLDSLSSLLTHTCECWLMLQMFLPPWTWVIWIISRFMLSDFHSGAESLPGQYSWTRPDCGTASCPVIRCDVQERRWVTMLLLTHAWLWGK